MHILLLLLFFALTIPALLSSFVGFPLYNDEGFFIYLAKDYAAGSTPYKELLIDYGPALFWFSYPIFKIVGLTHVGSRIAIFVVALLTSTILLFTARRTLKSPLFIAAPSLFWLYASTTFAFDGLHPGWFIALLLSFQGYLLMGDDRTRNPTILAVSTSFIFALKPHIGFCSLAAIAIHYMLLANRRRLAITIATLYLGFVCIVLQSMLFYLSKGIDGVIHICFQLVAASIPLILALKTELKERNPKYSYAAFTFIAVFVLSMGVVGLLSIYLYGARNLYLGLFQSVAKHYSVLLSNPIPFVKESLVLAAFGLIMLSASCFQNQRLKLLLRFFVISIVFLLVSLGQHINLVGWFLFLIFLVFMIFENSNFFTEPLRALTILSSCHMLHAFASPMAQMHYATPLSWILLCIILAKAFSTLEERGFSTPLLPYALCLLSFLLLISPVASNSVKALEPHKISTQCSNKLIKGIRLDQALEEELCQLVDFIKSNSTSNDKILTIPGTFSLNLLTQRNNPSKVISFRWSTLPPEYLERLLGELSNTKYIIINLGSGRLAFEKESASKHGFDTRLAAQIKQYFRKIPNESWQKNKLNKNPMFELYTLRKTANDS